MTGRRTSRQAKSLSSSSLTALSSLMSVIFICLVSAGVPAGIQVEAGELEGVLYNLNDCIYAESYRIGVVHHVLDSTCNDQMVVFDVAVVVHVGEYLLLDLKG